jgi:hypothetical protein
MNEEELIIVLDDYDKNHFAELIDIYLEPKSRFRIKNDGTVIFEKHGPFIDWFVRSENQVDFLNCFQAIVKVMLDDKVKGSIPYIQSLCGEAMGELMATNNRKQAVTSLLLAHLNDSQPNFNPGRSRNRELMDDIQIVEQSRRRKGPVKVYFGGGGDMANLADFINERKALVIFGNGE